jgi:hypothetical protein
MSAPWSQPRNIFWEIGTRSTCVIGKFPAEEVSSNLHRLKQIMETGRVTDTSYFGDR